jgi:hypothetical protein
MVFRTKTVIVERSGVRTVINDSEAYLEVILDGEGVAARADYREGTLTLFFIRDGDLVPAITVPLTENEADALREMLSVSGMDLDAAGALDYIATMTEMALVKLKSNTPGVTVDERTLGRVLDFINRASFFYGMQ